MALPDGLDFAGAREQAGELRRGVVSGDSFAIDRVLGAHPKYAGRGRERLREERFSLRDAQVTVANELGFATWRELVDAADEQSGVRRAPPWDQFEHSHLKRAFDEARQRGHNWCGPEHLLLAILNPAEPTDASHTLNDARVTYEEAVARSPRASTDDSQGCSTSPAYHHCAAFASGLAIAQGARAVSDEHILLALLYDDHRDTGSAIVDVGADPDEIYEALGRRGVLVPPLRPPVPATPWGPMGPHLYFPDSVGSAVTRTLSERYPKAFWVFSASTWRPGYSYVYGEDDLDLPATVLAAVADPSLIDVVPSDEAIGHEAE